MNMTEELNILDKHINYIAGYEAGTPFIDITTITFHKDSTVE